MTSIDDSIRHCPFGLSRQQQQREKLGKKFNISIEDATEISAYQFRFLVFDTLDSFPDAITMVTPVLRIFLVHYIIQILALFVARHYLVTRDTTMLSALLPGPGSLFLPLILSCT